MFFTDSQQQTLNESLFCPAGALLAAEYVKGSVQLSVEEGKDTRLHVSESVTQLTFNFIDIQPVK